MTWPLPYLDMLRPPSALARNASGSNLDFDFLATTQSATRWGAPSYYRPIGSFRLSGSRQTRPAAAGQSARIRDLIVSTPSFSSAKYNKQRRNALHDVSARLCRWLLQTGDEINSNTIPFTHEFLANMLGVRRSTVSQTASELQADGVLRTDRGPNQAAQTQRAREQRLPLL
jgi:Crp-like helix-turn-helix domain